MLAVVWLGGASVRTLTRSAVLVLSAASILVALDLATAGLNPPVCRSKDKGDSRHCRIHPKCSPQSPAQRRQFWGIIAMQAMFYCLI